VKIVIDTYAWVELLLGSEKGKKVVEILENAENVCTPSIVLAESARKFLREGNDESTVAEWLDIINAASNIAQIDPALALEAAKCHGELSERAKRFKQNTPSLFDAIVLATARINQCKVLTGDEHFKDLPETLWLS
jgi:predicted nucleic acid-binding protein